MKTSFGPAKYLLLSSQRPTVCVFPMLFDSHRLWEDLFHCPCRSFILFSWCVDGFPGDVCAAGTTIRRVSFRDYSIDLVKKSLSTKLETPIHEVLLNSSAIKESFLRNPKRVSLSTDEGPSPSNGKKTGSGRQDPVETSPEQSSSRQQSPRRVRQYPSRQQRVDGLSIWCFFLIFSFFLVCSCFLLLDFVFLHPFRDSSFGE